jgi:hypothetical protein
MLGQMKGISGVVVARDQLHKTEGFSQLIHSTFRPVKVIPGDTRGHDLMAGAVHQQVESAATPVVERNVLARAENCLKFCKLDWTCDPTDISADVTV